MAKKRSKGGRPSDLTPDAQAKICEALLAGTTRESAAQYAGIGSRTFSRWLADGRRAASGKFRQFWLAVEAAESECQRGLEKVILKAAQGIDETTTKTTAGIDKDGNKIVRTETTKRTVYDVRAAEWWLERRRRRDYSNQDRLIKDAVERTIKKAIEDGTLAITGGDSSGGEAAGESPASPKRRKPGAGGDPE